MAHRRCNLIHQQAANLSCFAQSELHSRPALVIRVRILVSCGVMFYSLGRLTPEPSLSLEHTRSLTHSLALSLSRSFTLSLSRSVFLSLTHTLTRSRSQSHTHSLPLSQLSYVWNGHASSISGVYAVDITHGPTSQPLLSWIRVEGKYVVKFQEMPPDLGSILGDVHFWEVQFA